MDNKPKFGINADSPEDKPTEPTVTPNSSQQPQFGTGAANTEATSTPNQDQPQFGTTVNPAESADNTPNFGTDSVHPQANTEGKSIGHWLKSIFSMQPVSFWLKQYAFAIVAYFMMISIVTDVTASTNGFFILDALFYPFTVTILQEIGRGSKGKGGNLWAFFFGYSVGAVGGSLIWIGIYALIRWFIFMMKFLFSVFIGVIGLIYMISQAKKMDL
ncbi:hypothetical protein FD04_GL001331 [Secundilactobacillus odoratitofui DSM 19909 = JCM 15043]|uniref:Uncharacterized protein n=1 Tax=Secundilactobacillus odoratitofui DSM 19909 = JCM 15043 TaxID=1423776 RepID=A0A0R1LN85_9LACO|nr:hypothetical protein [Secundilactobacillus odoratitofui]KRK97317.1 hypothetical protein FD04_GL001331 [Secundilactobacillus odoratitofui DSM 19909 = JCM 15043]